jgi:hypothetical protein
MQNYQKKFVHPMGLAHPARAWLTRQTETGHFNKRALRGLTRHWPRPWELSVCNLLRRCDVEDPLRQCLVGGLEKFYFTFDR